MISESARMSSAAEARFRIDKPNSRRRTVKVIALDRPAESVVDALARGEWDGAAFFKAAELTDHPARLAEAVHGADLVVMIATAGETTPGVAAIGEACSDRRVTTTGLILGSEHSTDDALSRTLTELRPWILMLVLANSKEYIEDMLRALRA